MFRESTMASSLIFLPLVSDSDRSQWQVYSQKHQDWLKESYEKNTRVQPFPVDIWSYPEDATNEKGCAGERLRMEQGQPEKEPSNSGPYAPMWQVSPPLPANDTSSVNYNVFAKATVAKAINMILYTREPVLLSACYQSTWFGASDDDSVQAAAIAPVFDGFDDEANIVAYYIALLDVSTIVSPADDASTDKVAVMLKDTCGETFLYSDNEINVKKSMEMTAPLVPSANYSSAPSTLFDEQCIYHVHVSPALVYHETNDAVSPAFYTMCVVAFLPLSPSFCSWPTTISFTDVSTVSSRLLQ